MFLNQGPSPPQPPVPPSPIKHQEHACALDGGRSCDMNAVWRASQAGVRGAGVLRRTKPRGNIRLVDQCPPLPSANLPSSFSASARPSSSYPHHCLPLPPTTRIPQIRPAKVYGRPWSTHVLGSPCGIHSHLVIAWYGGRRVGTTRSGARIPPSPPRSASGKAVALVEGDQDPDRDVEDWNGNWNKEWGSDESWSW